MTLPATPKKIWEMIRMFTSCQISSKTERPKRSSTQKRFYTLNVIPFWVVLFLWKQFVNFKAHFWTKKKEKLQEKIPFLFFISLLQFVDKSTIKLINFEFTKKVVSICYESQQQRRGRVLRVDESSNNRENTENSPNTA